ncbi:hypothetical protein SAMN05444008_11563 [Cnuella takakiae]|uniref:Uncharacterized protein n=1 Tax=Cnuella takakiae TaxID=1302690 RepID=A0A1M5G1M3_9BACT|nr:hypothetical protein [Cnuella takakiae]OLY92297.1 hypothetical protein BUE76_10625 [Cnuella takakiae]SHF97623.1 hypothetical protein SAMN05444008_11563 [Cnuella takakiae]
MGSLYKNYKSGDVKNAAPGYGPNAFLTPVDYFTDLKTPVISPTPVLGEAVTIATSHVYATGKKSIEVYCVPKTVSGDGEMSGEVLGKVFRWTPKIIVAGDGPELLEMMQNLLNGSFILHIEDVKKCETGSGFVQFGSKCTPCTVVEGSFKSGTQGDGRKQFEFTLEAFDKYFYTGALEVMA